MMDGYKTSLFRWITMIILWVFFQIHSFKYTWSAWNYQFFFFHVTEGALVVQVRTVGIYNCSNLVFSRPLVRKERSVLWVQIFILKRV